MIIRRLAGVILGLMLAVAPAGPAEAHNALRSTTPADGQQLASVPATIDLVFDEPAIALGTQVVVTGPSGEVQQGAPQLVDSTVTQPLAPGSPAGHYEVLWRVTSADGHPVSGTFGFTAAAAGTGSPAPSASASAVAPAPTPNQAAPGAAIPLWAWLVTLLVALLALGSIGYHLWQRRRS